MWLGMAQQTKPRGPSRLLVVVTEPGLEVVQGESQRSGGHSGCVLQELQGGLRLQAERQRAS